MRCRRAASVRTNSSSVTLVRPVEPERLGEVAQPSEAMLVDVGHHTEHAGVGRQQRIGDGEVGRQRERRVLLLGVGRGRNRNV